MFRVLLPDGELTLSSRIEFLKETTSNSITRLVNASSGSDADTLFVHLKAPYTTHKGVVIRGLSPLDIEDVKSSILRDSYYDFSRLDFGLDSGRSFFYASEDEFAELLAN